jgi:hypothetical protein
MTKSWEWIVGPIKTEERAAAVLGKLGKGWYVFAGFEAAVYLSLLVGGQLALFVLRLFLQPGAGDVVLCAIAGYFLPRTRSRLFAIALLLYAIGNAGAGVGLWIEGGIRTIFSTLIFQLLLALRCVQVTMTYHSKAGSVTIWKNVAIIVALQIGSILVVLIGAGVLEAVFAWEIPVDIPASLKYVACIAVYFTTRRRFPLIMPPPASA